MSRRGQNQSLEARGWCSLPLKNNAPTELFIPSCVIRCQFLRFVIHQTLVFPFSWQKGIYFSINLFIYDLYLLGIWSKMRNNVCYIKYLCVYLQCFPTPLVLETQIKWLERSRAQTNKSRVFLQGHFWISTILQTLLRIYATANNTLRNC